MNIEMLLGAIPKSSLDIESAAANQGRFTTNTEVTLYNQGKTQSSNIPGAMQGDIRNTSRQQNNVSRIIPPPNHPLQTHLTEVRGTGMETALNLH